ncbi:S1C family serine protease [Patescibacteria group bacterium]|nr:S1C family serine protease [Patescibacteria group bacterium]
MKDIKPSSKKKMGTIPTHSSPMQPGKRGPRSFFLIILTIIISLVVGALAGILGTRLLLPYLVTLPYFEESQLVAPEGTEVIIEKKEVIEVKEGGGAEEAVRKVNSATVSIVSESGFETLVGDIEQIAEGISGFVLTADGLIVTNKHYIEDLSEKYYVVLADGSKHEVQSIIMDPLLDVAFLSIDVDNLPVVELGVSDDLTRGQRVVVLSDSLPVDVVPVLTGVISSLNKTYYYNGEVFHGMIKTDIPLTPSHSGSPLLSAEGKVVGINTVVASQGEVFSYTIPIDYIKSGYQEMIKTREIKRPYIGFHYTDITPEFAAMNNLSVKHGALLYATNEVPAVKKGSPALAAGLKAQDIIIRVNGEELTDVSTLFRTHLMLSPVEDITLTVLRDNQEKEIVVTPEPLEE